MPLSHPATLRTALLTGPLALRADQLAVLIQKGRLSSPRMPDNSRFRLDYTLEVIVTGFGGDPADLLFLVTDWLHRAAPAAKEDAVTFDIDFLGGETAGCDVMIHVALTEYQTLRADPDGTRLVPLPVPDAQSPDWIAAAFGRFPAAGDPP